jgi:hypothetical protein
MAEASNSNSHKPLYISVGEDCAISYHLDLLGLREYSLPFDWAIFKDLSKLIKLIEDIFTNNESIFLDQCNWKLKPLSKKTHLLQDGNTFSKYRAIHLLYRCEYPHEFTEEIDWETFVKKYTRRINRFKELANSDRKIIFIRGTTNSMLNVNLDLKTCLTKYFPNFQDIKYIDYTKYEWINSPDGWTRPNINLMDFL